MPESVALNQDCLSFMRTLPDNYFDLCVADPPYGAGFTEGGGCKGWFSKYHQNDSKDDCSQSVQVEREREREKRWNRFGQRFDRYKHDGDADGRDVGGEVRKKIIAWDVAPEKEYFDEIFRVSRNQIIWGGNYFYLPPTRCFLVWRKLTISESFTMAMAEYAWTSFNGNAKVFECAPQGRPDDPRFHPCLPAGTKVRFNGEWKSIENVNVGDRNEFGVVAAITTHDAEKMVVITVGSKTITATWNHPFLVKRMNALFWINAEQVQEGDELLSLWKPDMRSPTKDTFATERTESVSVWNTALFGKKTMARFLMGCKSITRTLIRPITIFPICSLSLPLNTNGYTKVADLRTAFGISRANVAASSRRSQKKTGIFHAGGSTARFANRATSRKYAKNVVCVSQTVGSVKIINEKTKVYNLSLDGIPAFETELGITHNTQKPVDLYRWIYNLFAKPGMKVFDPYLGSGSSRIAAWNAGLDFTGVEIDPIYFEKQEERFALQTAQYSLFLEE